MHLVYYNTANSPDLCTKTHISDGYYHSHLPATITVATIIAITSFVVYDQSQKIYRHQI
jgi:hypothetical protein